MPASLFGVAEETRSIWVYLEQADGKLERVSLEVLGKGRSLADQAGFALDGLLLGSQVGRLAEQVIACGADQVWLADHPLLEQFTIEAYVQVAFEALMQGRPSIFLLGATPNGRDLAGRLAVRLRTGLNADCTDLKINPESGLLTCEVSGFGGGILALIAMENHRPQMATIRPGVFPALEPNQQPSVSVLRPPVIYIPVQLSEDMLRTRILERVVGQGVDLTRAPVLVAGGRGVDGNIEMLRELAELLGGEIGATRPMVDEGYIERERQVGQTGAVCSPSLAVCSGISGAFHFVVGIEKAGTVIAINSDPQAPIFEYADACIVGDVHQLIPKLIAALRGEQEAAYA